LRLARQGLTEARAAAGGAKAAQDPRVLDAYGWYDGCLGMLTYALVRNGRAPEAAHLAQGQVAAWRAGQMSEGLGARWSYRLATAQVAMRQHAAGLENAQRADEMLERSGASAASHTRWLARNEQVKALIGLRRWAEADTLHREFLASIPADSLARERANDWRLRALLAAKNGRFDEALETVERIHRFRLRLYGEGHPQVQEAAGVRALVRLLDVRKGAGDLAGAWSDYQPLFAALLDTPGGWLDLDLAGARGFVLGLAFDEFLRELAERAQRGEKLDPAWTDRALQVADRLQTGSTQRALTDATSRLLAATPALRALLEAEQTLRAAAGSRAGELSALLAEEDKLRRTQSSEAVKAELQALPEPERKQRRKAMADELAALREKLAAQRTQSQAAREALTAQRERVARAYPAYADLVTPTLPGTAALQKLLAPNEALLVAHSLPEATLVWLVSPGQPARFAVSKLGSAAWQARVGRIREALDLSHHPATPLPVAELNEVWRELVAPVEPLASTQILMVAADGALAALPFAAVLTEPDPKAFVARRWAVTQLPSAGALHALRRSASPAPAPVAFFGVGDPLFAAAGKAPAGRAALGAQALRYDAAWGFSYADVPPLPDTRTELLALASALGADPKADLLLGAAATREAVLAAPLSNRRVVAFATHGLMPGELPGISKPALALAPGADLQASPLLELDDVLTLRLNAQTVLLSACNTAAGEQGGAAMSGLVRGFFFAGGRSVLATHWSVESASAAALTSASFRAGAGPSRALALRQAQLSMIEGQLGGGRWAHPFYWAGYALFGDPQR
jgi:CHAT domain-containing protein